MIRTNQPPPDLTATTTEAHVRAVAKECGLPVVPAGGFLFCVRRVPLIGSPIIYKARVGS